MITYIQAIILGALQGVTELFPVSSLGHSIILPALFGWNIDQGADAFLVFLVATHFATALVLFLYFLRDWVRILTNGRLLSVMVVATIPAGLLGLLLQTKLQVLFASPIIAACFLALNGAMLYGAERLARGRADLSMHTDPDTAISHMSWWKAICTGLAQSLALLPGFSRTGSALAGGLLNGLSRSDAARFAFLLATPLIGAAAILKLPLIFRDAGAYPVGPIIVGALVAAGAALLSVRFLTKYFEHKTMKPFAIYCAVAGIVAVVILGIR